MAFEISFTLHFTRLPVMIFLAPFFQNFSATHFASLTASSGVNSSAFSGCSVHSIPHMVNGRGCSDIQLFVFHCIVIDYWAFQLDFSFPTRRKLKIPIQLAQNPINLIQLIQSKVCDLKIVVHSFINSNLIKATLSIEIQRIIVDFKPTKIHEGNINYYLVLLLLKISAWE